MAIKKMAKNSTERVAEIKGMGQSNPNSEAFEDYNGVTKSNNRNNDVTIGGAEIKDKSSKLNDE